MTCSRARIGFAAGPQEHGGSRNLKAIVRLVLQNELVARAGPGVAVEIGKRDAAPMQVVAADRVAVDLDVHDDGVGLLDLADLAQLDVIAEAGGEVGAEGVAAQVSRGHAGHQEEDDGAADEDHEHQRRSDARQGESEMTMFLGIVGMSCLNVGGVAGAAHFHQHERPHGHHHE